MFWIKKHLEVNLVQSFPFFQTSVQDFLDFLDSFFLHLGEVWVKVRRWVLVHFFLRLSVECFLYGRKLVLVELFFLSHIVLSSVLKNLDFCTCPEIRRSLLYKQCLVKLIIINLEIDSNDVPLESQPGQQSSCCHQHEEINRHPQLPTQKRRNLPLV